MTVGKDTLPMKVLTELPLPNTMLKAELPLWQQEQSRSKVWQLEGFNLQIHQQTTGGRTMKCPSLRCFKIAPTANWTRPVANNTLGLHIMYIILRL